MSTDLHPLWARIHDLRVQINDAEARAEQAERAKEDAETDKRRAEERAFQAETDRDGWAGFAHALTNHHLIDQYANDRLGDDMRLFITEELYTSWSTGTRVYNLNAETLVNGCQEEQR